ncbi:hypothetical protein LZ30DRAFT_588587, partial [Colletotrichum cereale]
ERFAIQKVCGYAQIRMFAAVSPVMIFRFIALCLINNFNLKKEMNQTKRLIF